jgi:hypothetical protein
VMAVVIKDLLTKIFLCSVFKYALEISAYRDEFIPDNGQYICAKQ